MSRFGTVVLAMLGLAVVAPTARAQCGCLSGGYAGAVSYAPPVAYPPLSYGRPTPPYATRPSYLGGPASIAYVNKLATPIPRANYTLQYAVHLTDGRVLLSDFLPPGQTVRGIETQSGEGARRLRASMNGGAVTVRDPQTDTTVAVLGPNASTNN